jgi:hypothetical protein
LSSSQLTKVRQGRLPFAPAPARLCEPWFGGGERRGRYPISNALSQRPTPSRVTELIRNEAAQRRINARAVLTASTLRCVKYRLQKIFDVLRGQGLLKCIRFGVYDTPPWTFVGSTTIYAHASDRYGERPHCRLFPIVKARRTITPPEIPRSSMLLIILAYSISEWGHDRRVR